jgi:tetratricopeptide (TPR) repeat protein
VAIEAYSVGTVFEYQGRYGAALKSRTEAYEQFQKLSDKSFWNAEVQSGYGRSLMLAGQLDEAKKILDQALKVARDQGNQTVVVRVLNDLGEYSRLTGDPNGGRAPLDEAQQIAAKLGDRSLVLRTQLNQALVHVRDRARATQTAPSLATLAREAETQGLTYLSLEAAVARADALLTAGQAVPAATEVQRAITRADNMGMRMLQARGHYVAARAAGANAAVQRRHFSEVKRILEELARESRPGDLTRRADVKEMLEGAKAAGS